MSFTNCLVLLLSLSVAVQSLTTPIVLRSHHHAIAARVAAPAPIDVPTPPVGRRQNSRRCKPRGVSSSVAVPTSSSPPPVAVKPAAQQPQPTTSSTPVPQPTTTPSPAPQPTTTYAAPATTTTAASASSGNEPSFMTGTQTGQGTFYATGLGACGITNKDTDYIAAVSHLLFDAYPGYNGVNPNDNPVCGKTITAHYQGKSVTITVTDRCQGCLTTDLDFSPSAFDQLADPSVGRISGMTWDWD